MSAVTLVHALSEGGFLVAAPENRAAPFVLLLHPPRGHEGRRGMGTTALLTVSCSHLGPGAPRDFLVYFSHQSREAQPS